MKTTTTGSALDRLSDRVAGLDVARVEVVSFDLDGTLIDSRTAWRHGFAAPFAQLAARYPALLALGDSAYVHDHVFQPFLTTIWERAGGEWSPNYVRDGWRMLLQHHAAPDGTTPDWAAADAAHEEYEATWPAMMRLFEDSLTVLDAVQARYPMILITNGNTAHQRMKIESHDLARWFRHVVVSEEVGLLKPDPAIFALALAPLGARAESALHIGDMRAQDVAGARAAGWQSAWVNRAGAPAVDEHQPDVEIAALEELLDLLELR
ncbi:MAG: HAD family hydrolase [Dehalococcoidia bacterium]|nr:HAD family hydrolase [Dehalococcoidia bacterium]